MRSNRRLLVFLVLSLSACAAPPVDRVGTQPSARAPSQPASGPLDPMRVVRVACVGGSSTFGTALPDRARDAYPGQLGRLLAGWEVRNFGVVGGTVVKKGDRPFIKNRAYSQVLAYQPDVVVMMLGTNDSKPPNWQYQDDFSADYKDLIDAFRRANPGVRLYTCLVAPAFAGHWGINEQTIRDGVNPLIRRIATETGTTLVDMHTLFLGKTALFVDDQIHPNRQGSYVMAAELYRALTGRTPPPWAGNTAATQPGARLLVGPPTTEPRGR